VAAVLVGEHERWCDPGSKGGYGQGHADIRPVIAKPPASRVYGEAVMSVRPCLPLTPVPAAGVLDVGFLIGTSGIRVTSVTCQVISSASLRR
jgi:hypothetical protein